MTTQITDVNNNASVLSAFLERFNALEGKLDELIATQQELTEKLHDVERNIAYALDGEE